MSMNSLKSPEWKAHWIWQSGDPAKSNTYVYFRRSFSLQEKPSGATCYVSGDTGYKLYLNGTYVGNGPILTEPRWQSYDTYDVRHLLRVGENVIGAIVYHFGNGVGNPEAYTMHWSRGGFLCQIDMQYGGEREEAITTDSSWDVLESSAWDRNSPKIDDMTYAELYDATREPGSWLEPDFQDRNWVPATVVTLDDSVKQWVRSPSAAKVLPWTELEPRSIPDLVREELIPQAIVKSGEVLELAEPNSIDLAQTAADLPIRMSLEEILPFKYTSITNAESLLGTGGGPAVMTPMADSISYDDFEGVYDPTITLDTGRLLNGRVLLDIEAAAGSLVDIGYGQVLVNGRVIPYLSRRTALADQYATREGRQSFETFGWRHFRYVQLTFRRMRKPLKVHKIRMVSESYPAARKGLFECDDEMLNWIWRACVETAHLCTHDRFMDNPVRERREHTGDGCHILDAIYAAFGDLDIIRKYFVDVKRGRTAYGVLPSSILPQRREPERTFVDGGIFILKVWEYYEFFANRDVLADMFESLYAFIRHLEKYTDDNGLLCQLPYPIYFDWSDIDLSGTSLCLNAVFAQAMKRISDMASVLGRRDISEEYREKHQRLATVIPGLFWDEQRGMFADAIVDGLKSQHTSEHANFLMILFGLADARQIESILECLREPSLEVGQLEPSFFWATEGLFKMNEGRFAVDMMKRRYARMRKQGLDTVSEMWSLRGDRYPGRWRSRDSRSAVHSCGVSPAYLLSRYVLGISPARPGFEEVSIAPQVCGLKRVKGRWPSPLGSIDVMWEKSEDSFRIECQLPHEMKGRIVLPLEIFPIKSLKINGRRMDIEEIDGEGIQVCGNTKVEAAC